MDANNDEQLLSGEQENEEHNGIRKISSEQVEINGTLYTCQKNIILTYKLISQSPSAIQNQTFYAFPFKKADGEQIELIWDYRGNQYRFPDDTFSKEEE